MATETMGSIPASPAKGADIADWRPEDDAFGENTGKSIAYRNLWISVPCLLLSFEVWMVWSVVVAKLPGVGFAFSNEQLFWLAALPGLSGATLRIAYSFMPAIFGGRLWTTLATWSLLIPALGMGFAVQDPATPYWIFLVLALLCGLGGAESHPPADPTPGEAESAGGEEQCRLELLHLGAGGRQERERRLHVLLVDLAGLTAPHGEPDEVGRRWGLGGVPPG